jgi:hypothetical protein
LLRENLKRFWAIPAIGMICWFFAGIFPFIIEDYNRTNFLATAARPSNPFFAIFILAFPLIASVTTLRYLFSSGSVAAMHTLPLTRGRLYCTNYVSCAVMTLAPVAVTFALLTAADGFSGRMLAAFALLALLALLYTALFHIAAMLTGNVIASIGVAGFLAAVLLGLLMLSSVYFQEMLFGYTFTNYLEALIFRLTPVLHIFAERARSPVWITVYALAIPALYAAGAALYSRRSLERAGDSVVFPAFETVFTLVVTFAGMTLMSVIFQSAGWGRFPYNLGSVVGAALVLLAAQMLMKKSVRIFNRRTLAHGAAFAAAVLLFLAVLSFDLTGFETRVPDPARVKAAELSRRFTPALDSKNIFIYGTRQDFNYDYEPELSNNIIFTDPENIRLVTELHKGIAELRGGAPYYYAHNHYLTLDYRLDSGRLSRAWTLPYKGILDDANARALFESEEYKKQTDLRNPALGQPFSISIHSSANYIPINYDEMAVDSWSSTDIILSSDVYGEFLNALSEDMRNETWDELISCPTAVAGLDIEYQANVEYADGSRGNTTSAHANIAVMPYYTRTIEWLTARGYYERLTEWKKHIVSAELTHLISSSLPYSPVIADSADINNPALILRALDSSVSEMWDHTDYWQMIVTVETGDGRYTTGLVAYFPGDSPTAAALRSAAN